MIPAPPPVDSDPPDPVSPADCAGTGLLYHFFAAEAQCPRFLADEYDSCYV